jgi:hypothetical protein
MTLLLVSLAAASVYTDHVGGDELQVPIEYSWEANLYEVHTPVVLEQVTDDSADGVDQDCDGVDGPGGEDTGGDTSTPDTDASGDTGDSGETDESGDPDDTEESEDAGGTAHSEAPGDSESEVPGKDCGCQSGAGLPTAAWVAWACMAGARRRPRLPASPSRGGGAHPPHSGAT